jgi:hypothetical protein
MFDLIFGGAQAYQQVGLFIGALVCFGLGALILGNAIYWHLHALRATGTIIGVVAEGGTYAPVYRYTAPDGQIREAKSNISSGSPAGKQTGRVVPLLISPHNPAEAQQAGIRSLESVFILIGVVMVVVGLWIGTTAITAYPVTRMTWIMAAGMAIYFAWHVRRSVTPGARRPFLDAWKQWRNLRTPAAGVDLSRVKPIEQLVSAADLQRSAEQRSKQSKWAVPIVGFFIVILVGVAIHEGQRVARLEANGVRADGQVVDLKGESSSGGHGGTSYYPVVRFRTATDALVEFKDSIGSNPPSYHVGDKVTVLYLADDPRHQAIIDRGGFWNWIIPGLLLLGALLLLGVLLALFRSSRQRAGVNSVTSTAMGGHM